MLRPVCQRAQGKSLSFRNGFVGCLAVSKHTRKFKHFGKPTAIILALKFDCKNHKLFTGAYPIIRNPTGYISPRAFNCGVQRIR